MGNSDSQSCCRGGGGGRRRRGEDAQKVSWGIGCSKTQLTHPFYTFRKIDNILVTIVADVVYRVCQNCRFCQSRNLMWRNGSGRFWLALFVILMAGIHLHALLT